MSRTLVLLALLIPASVRAQEHPAAGHWEGAIILPTGKLEVKVDLAVSGGVWSGSIDIPAQGAKGLPLNTFQVSGDSLRFAIAGVPGAPTFDGVLREGRLAGAFRQSGFDFTFDLGRERLAGPDRPQTPVPPFPYTTEEVTYSHGEVTLAGTLTLPEGTGPFPAALLITGSGTQDRDETIFDHKPFAVIADYLTRGGIAVLRVDDRGIGGSKGPTSTATSEDFAEDVEAGVGFLASRPGIAPGKIGLIGHSEGGIIAPMVAARDERVAWIILMAGTGVPLGDVVVAQTRLLSKAAGLSDSVLTAQEEVQTELMRRVAAGADSAALRPMVRRLLDVQMGDVPPDQRPAESVIQTAVTSGLAQVMLPWYRYALRYDPRTALRRVKVPVLALNGTLDLQVPPEQNLPEIQKALQEAGNPDVTIQRLPGLNHLFQHATTGAVDEYNTITETVSPEVLQIMREWILARVGPV